MSSFLLYLGVKKSYPKLRHHTLILSERYKGLIEDIFDNKVLADDFSMYLHVPTLTDPNMAPEGAESMYLLIPVPNTKADIDWDEMTEPFTNKVLEFMETEFGMKDFRKNIEVLETFTPVDFESQRNNYLGACWSLEPSLFQIANFRPHNKSEDVDRLYLVGASTHPGGGVPGVMLTAETTEKVIRSDFGI
jgi:phytoene desaturase